MVGGKECKDTMKKKDSIQKIEIAILGCYLMLILEVVFATLSKNTDRSVEIIERIYSFLFGTVTIVVFINVILSIVLLVKSIKQRKLSGILIALPTFILFSIALVAIMMSV